MHKIILCELITICFLLNSCGLYNLELNIKNPLDSINIFSSFSNKDSDVANNKQCKIEIDDENWEAAIEVCGNLPENNENIALYASALHNKHGGDLFILREVALDENDEFYSIIDGYTNNLPIINGQSITDLNEAVTKLDNLSNKTPNNYFQLAFTYFTLACAYIKKAANDNGNPDGEITALDIEYMGLTDLNNFYNNLVECQLKLVDAGISESIFDEVTSSVSDLSGWLVANEVTKETLVKALFGY